MNCQNCGAAMELMGARRYFFCRHCGAFHFPELVDEGVRVLQRDAARACGVCKRPLAAAELYDQFAVRYCERCRGVLVSRRDFAEIIETRRAWASTPPVAPSPIEPREIQRAIACPECSTTMSTHPYYGPGNVILDTCDRCDLVWLDFGEMQQIVDAPGRDRGRRPRPDDAAGPDVLQMLADRFGRADG
jgi:Zn-finger nucleic acid-binding protein